MAVDNSVLLHRLEPLIHKPLDNNKNVEKLSMLISEYLDKNINKLTTQGPTQRTTFLDSDYNNFYNILDLDPEVIKSIVKESDYIKSQWQIMNNPFNSAIFFVIRYFAIKKNENMMKQSIIYFSLSMYPSLHAKYFKYEPNENIMNYAISHLNNKYKIRQFQTFYHAFIDTAFGNNTNYMKQLISASDKDIVTYVHGLKTRLNLFIKVLAVEFYKAEKEGGYLNELEENNDPDNLVIVENDSIVIEQITTTVILRLVTEGPDMRIVSISAKTCGISVNELRNTTVNLCADNNNREELKYVIGNLIYLFIFEGHNKKEMVRSNDFLMFSIKNVYEAANTRNENIIKIKEYLDIWLNKYSAHYRKTNRPGTLNNFRKSLFLFIIFTIQQNYK